MADFPLRVVDIMQDSLTLPTKALQFGDGYEQLMTSGFDRGDTVWSVSVVINNAIEARLLQDFLIEHGQYKPFDWKSPRDFIASSYTIEGAISGTRRNGGGFQAVFLKFKKYYAPFQPRIEIPTSTQYYLDLGANQYSATQYYLDVGLIFSGSTQYYLSFDIDLPSSTNYSLNTNAIVSESTIYYIETELQLPTNTIYSLQ